MAELKTKSNDLSVTDFLHSMEDEKRRTDCYKVLEIMQEATQAVPKMWGSSIIGFGEYHYKYKSGREGVWFITGFSPRKNDLTLYLVGGLAGHEDSLQQLGKHKTGKSCLYIKKLDDINLNILKKIIIQGVAAMKAG